MSTLKDWDTPFGPSKLLEKQMSEVIYMNCPKCGAKMAKQPDICTSDPPQYKFYCPNCRNIEFVPCNYTIPSMPYSATEPKAIPEVVNDLMNKPVLPDEWELFRREAAKDAMCAMITADTNDGIYSDPDEVCGMALLYADKLIDLLREGEERR